MTWEMTNPVLTLLTPCQGCGAQFCAVLREGDKVPQVCRECREAALRKMEREAIESLNAVKP